MTNLRTLVNRYVDGSLDFQSFRRAFVMEFLTTENSSATLQACVMSIESECADASEGLISEEILRARLAEIVEDKRPTIQLGTPLIVGDARYYRCSNSLTLSRLQIGTALAAVGRPLVLSGTVSE